MNKNVIIGIALGLAIGVLATLGVIAVTDNDNSMSSMGSSHMDMSMNDMNDQLEDLSGDDFDEAFIEMMIAHHQGALDMAELVPSRANHDELKELSEDIIAAQTKEIAQMKQWQEDWNFSGDSSESEMHHGM
jgi:uncharacterized protein (DUF305 family)